MSQNEADKIVDEIHQIIEDLPDRVKLKNAEYFESVASKADDILNTISTRGYSTDGQLTALRNMLSGLKKWQKGD